MRYGSVCSGIEAATSAWHSLGWTPQWFSEIEPFPSAVLAHHYPNVPNFGDMTKFKEWKLDDSTAIDVLVGGTPCQSFSVAGLRKGLDDPRGNLMLVYLAIAAKYQPKWLVWENVPGVLSSSGGEDFASLLRGMGELGYGFAYRILDAQYFGVAQRRRRVFVVGCLGDWRAAAAVLFERHSLSGHPAPSRETRESVAGTIGARTGRSIGAQDAACGHMIPWPPPIAPTLDAHYGDKMGLENQHINSGGGYIPSVAKCLITKTRLDTETETMIVLMDQGGGVMNILEDGTVGTLRRETHGHEPVIIQPIALAENTIGRQPQNGGNGDGFTVGGPMYTLNATGVHGVAVGAFGGAISDTVTAKFAKGAELLQQGAQNGGNCVLQPIAFSGKDYGADASVDLSPTLRAMPHNNSHANGGGQIAVVHDTQDPCVSDIAFAQGRNNGGENVLLQSMAVRRLTPVECERLQGFPDNYTNIPWRNKDEAPDGPRYKALGNSMAVPVMHWIGKRIQMVEDL